MVTGPRLCDPRDMTGVGVRLARPEDATALARVHTLGWQQGFAGLLPADFLASRVVTAESWRERLGKGSRYPTFVGAVGPDASQGPVVGFVTVGPARPPAPIAPGVGQLHALYVLAEAWGSGLGYALHTAGMDALRAAGFTEAVLWSLAGNDRALAFYHRQGWADTSTTHVEHAAGADLPEHLLRLRLVRA